MPGDPSPRVIQGQDFTLYYLDETDEFVPMEGIESYELRGLRHGKMETFGKLAAELRRLEARQHHLTYDWVVSGPYSIGPQWGLLNWDGETEITMAIWHKNRVSDAQWWLEHHVCLEYRGAEEFRSSRPFDEAVYWSMGPHDWRCHEHRLVKGCTCR